MMIHYDRDFINLTVDTEKIVFINVEPAINTKDLHSTVVIGLTTGHTITVDVRHGALYDFMKVLNRYMELSCDFDSLGNPFLEDSVRYEITPQGYKACQMLGVETFGDLVKHSRQEFLALPQVGNRTVNELEELLNKHCLYFGWKVQ